MKVSEEMGWSNLTRFLAGNLFGLGPQMLTRTESPPISDLTPHPRKLAKLGLFVDFARHAKIEGPKTPKFSAPPQEIHRQLIWTILGGKTQKRIY